MAEILALYIFASRAALNIYRARADALVNPDYFRHARVRLSMNEKAQEDEFDEDDNEEIADGGDDVDVDHLFRDLDKRKRSGVKTGDPAWRKLEKYREERHTQELVSDFDDYDIGGDDLASDGAGSLSARRAKHRHAS
jgi:hypothetical protein